MTTIRPEINWFRALSDAEWFSGSTADSAERNLAYAYLELLRENGHLRIALEGPQEGDDE